MGDAMERALTKAAQGFERELSRILTSGEDVVERLARRIAEVLASAVVDGAAGAILGGRQDELRSTESEVGSVNQLAVAIAKAARRGVRFT